MKLRLIVNADDFGLHPAADESILLCYRSGVVTSTSLLVNPILHQPLDELAYKRTAVKKAMEAGLPLGIHFNLTEGQPTASHIRFQLIAQHTSSSESQKFLGKFGFRTAVEEALVDDKKRDLLNEEISIELRAQYEQFLRITNGVPPTHADGHQHFHVVDGLALIVATTLRSLGIEWIRIPKEESTLRHEASPRDLFHLQVSQQARSCESVYRTEGLRTTDAFLGLGLMDAPNGAEGFLSAVESVAREHCCCSCEVMVHPGYVDPSELVHCRGRNIDIANSTVAFCATEERLRERDTLTNRHLVETLRTNSRVALSSFKDLVSSID
eukprot:TRINITY_DN847_c0_g1_i1.p1 TRINITY_DN847_c0_g1~~TRINITY_DN847_c0_g1_i1.p1  ORF type:complete len:326 (-),score=45.60 TRINITY_DN847_c0_g1_i1:313-1290(-)